MSATTMTIMFDALEKWLYPVPPPIPRQRQKPMEVLALGMSRSGTESLREALLMLGYDHVYHGFDVPESEPQTFEAWTRLSRRKFGSSRSPADQGAGSLCAADFDEILGHCNAITDQQGAIFGAELMEAYPNAKVVLNWRDSEEWYHGIQRTFGVHMAGFTYQILPYFQARLYWRRRYYAEVLNAYFYGSLMLNGKWVYEEHCAKVHGIALEKSKQFLKWRVHDGWKPLCEFLDKPIPNEDFPSGNRDVQTLSRIQDYIKRDQRQAFMNLGSWIAIVIAAVFGIMYRFNG